MKKPDDFIAVHGEYTLRAEKMSKHVWWWCVYHNDDRIADSNATEVDTGRSQMEAKAKAELAYFIHSGVLVHRIAWKTTEDYVAEELTVKKN